MYHQLIRDYVNLDALRDFCRSNGLRVSGGKGVLFDGVENAIENGTLQADTFNAWVRQQLEYGHSRQLFFSHLSEDCCRILSNSVNVLSCLDARGLPTTDMDILLDTILPEGKVLTYLNVQTHERMVSEIKMCFTHTVELEPIEEGAPPRFENDYIWATISIPTKMLCVKVRPRGNQMAAQAEANRLFLEARGTLEDIFRLHFRTAGQFKTVLYNIFKSLTAAAELPYQRRVLPVMEDVIHFLTDISRRLELPSPRNPVDLPQRVSKLLERALIQTDFEVFRSSGEGKRGIIDKFYYSDRTGAQVQARAPEHEGIELADIYFDTRDSIDKLRTFDKLWVTWFRYDGGQVEPIKTKLEAHWDYYVVHFYTYLLREVETYVLREIAAFERMGLE